MQFVDAEDRAHRRDDAGHDIVRPVRVGALVLVRMSIDSLLSGETSYETLYEFENNAPMNFVYASDGRTLYGATYLTGVANVVRYDIATKTMDWLTNAETGMFRPLPLSADSLLAFRYTGKGFLPVILENRRREDVSAIRYLGYDVVVNKPSTAAYRNRRKRTSTGASSIPIACVETKRRRPSCMLRWR